VAARLVKGLTAITRFQQYRISTVSSSIVDNWAKIGALTFSFKCWKFDAMRLPAAREFENAESLLETYGAVRIPERETDYKWNERGERVLRMGPGYLIRPEINEIKYSDDADSSSVTEKYGAPDSGHREGRAMIEMRQAYVSAWEPDIGMLIVRNSSPEGGRYALKHPAYFASPKQLRDFSEEDLLNLTEADIEEKFYHILDYNLHQDVWDITSRTKKLLDLVYAVKEGIAEWKCGTNFNTAYQLDWSSGKKVLMQGPYSPGFEKVVEQLKHAAALAGQGRAEVPDLAFVHKRLPPFFPLKFSDSEGQVLDRFFMNPERLALLDRFVKAQASQAEIRLSGFGAFIQSGLNNEAELVLLSPERQSDVKWS